MAEELKFSRVVCEFRHTFLQGNPESALKRDSSVGLKLKTRVQGIMPVRNTISAANLPVGRSAWIHTKVVASRLKAEVPFEAPYFLLVQNWLNIP